MATDATGAPTPLGIPKYNTSADAPSGLGFNAAMDALDALIAARVAKPAGIASGEVPVWNGSAFVRSTTTRIGISSIASGTPDGTKFVRDDGTLAVPAVASGEELNYMEFTSPVAVTATTEGTANTVVTAGALTLDGSTAVLIDFFAPGALIGTNRIDFVLYQDGASIGRLSDSASLNNPLWPEVRLSRRLTPAAGSRTYSIRAYVNGGSGSVFAGLGGSGQLVPGYIRIKKAA